MFNLQAIVFLTVLYAVNAAMVVSVYDDDGSSEKQNINNCMYRECDQLCRRIGFPGGACVGDRCKCDIIQEMTTIQELKDCNSVNCNQLCRRMGFISGGCVDNHCRCDTYIKLKVPVATSNGITELRTCDTTDCNDLCQRLGFKNGTCNGNRCQCESFEQNGEIINMEKNTYYDVLSNNKIDECSSNSCKMMCQVEGYLGGGCIDDRCVCRKKENKHLKTLGGCSNPACNNFCISKNYSGGFCLGQICICY